MCLWTLTPCLHQTQTPDTKLDTSKTNWARAQHNPHTGKVWVSFHSTDDSFLNGMSKITVEDKDGATVADQGVGKPATAPVLSQTTPSQSLSLTKQSLTINQIDTYSQSDTHACRLNVRG